MAAILIVYCRNGKVVDAVTQDVLPNEQKFGRKGRLIVTVEAVPTVSYRTNSGELRWEQPIEGEGEYKLTAAGTDYIPSRAEQAAEKKKKAEYQRLEKLGRFLCHRRQSVKKEVLPPGQPLVTDTPATHFGLWVTDGTLTSEDPKEKEGTSTIRVTISEATWAAFGAEKAVIWSWNRNAPTPSGLLYQLGLAEDVRRRLTRNR